MSDPLPTPEEKTLSSHAHPGNSPSRPIPVDLSVIMPCFNEAESIERVVREWKEVLDEEAIAHEIVIVNDGSTDGTGRLLDRIRRDTPGIKVIHQLNSGPARATRRGYELCRGRFVLHAEASGRYEPVDFLRLWERREESPFVMAHRTHRLDSWLRRLGSRILRWSLTKGFNLSLSDPNMPFRLVRRDLALAALKRVPTSARGLNLWMNVILCQLIAGPVPEVAVPFRKRISHRLRRKQETLLSQSLSTLRDLIAMKYGNGTQPGLGKIVPAPIA